MIRGLDAAAMAAAASELLRLLDGRKAVSGGARTGGAGAVQGRGGMAGAPDAERAAHALAAEELSAPPAMAGSAAEEPTAPVAKAGGAEAPAATLAGAGGTEEPAALAAAAGSAEELPALRTEAGVREETVSSGLAADTADRSVAETRRAVDAEERFPNERRRASDGGTGTGMVGSGVFLAADRGGPGSVSAFSAAGGLAASSGSGGNAAAPERLFADASVSSVSGGLDPEAVSEFFRRDSRRYDSGFGS